MRHFKFIDVTGVGNSGKSAAADLLREFDGIYTPEYWFEFDFLRVPNGLLDLRHRLLENWSPIRSHYAIRAFIAVAEKMGRDPAWWDIPGQMRATSQRYDRRFGGEFRSLAKEFAGSFVKSSFSAEWPYDALEEGDGVRFARKILRRIGFRAALFRNVLIVDGTNFDTKARDYLTELYSRLVPQGTDTVVLNNGFEAFNPRPAFEMLGNKTRQIVVVRDPRDIYVSGLNRYQVHGADRMLMAFDNDGLGKSFLGTDDLKAFVERFRVYSRQLYKLPDERVLHLYFEDLVHDYETSKARICEFLGLDIARHVRPRQHFLPEKSAKNVGIWRRYSKPDELAYIAAELPDLVYVR